MTANTDLRIARARREKAARLANVLALAGADGTETGLTDYTWQLVAELAEVRLPSAATRDLTLALLRERTGAAT